MLLNDAELMLYFDADESPDNFPARNVRQSRKIEVGAFYWTDMAPYIVNPGREEQGSVSMYTLWGVLPPSELCGLAWQYLHRKRPRLISASQPSL